MHTQTIMTKPESLIKLELTWVCPPKVGAGPAS